MKGYQSTYISLTGLCETGIAACHSTDMHLCQNWVLWPVLAVLVLRHVNLANRLARPERICDAGMRCDKHAVYVSLEVSLRPMVSYQSR